MAPGTAEGTALAGKSSAPRRNNAARLFGYDVFLSFALGAPPRGTHSYASDLARRLRERDITVFFSEDEAAPGEHLDSTLVRALHRSRTLVIIANRATLEEPRWVRQEVEVFRGRHADRPIIPISVDGALQDATLAEQTQQWLEFGDKIWLDESHDAVANGIASNELVERLALAPAGRNSNTKWRWLVRGIAAVLMVLTVAAICFGVYAQKEARIALTNATEARKQKKIAVEKAAEAQTQKASAEANASEARKQKTAAEANATEAQRQQKIAIEKAAEAAQQRDIALEQERESKARELAAYANANLSEDPEKSILLAMHAVNATLRFGQPPLLAAEGALHEAVLSSQVHTTLRGHSRAVKGVAFSPDGQRLATASWDGTAKVWDTESGNELLTLRGHSLAVNGVAFSPDGKRLATASYDQTAKVWDAASGQELLTLKGHDSFVKSVAWSPDGKRLATASDDGTVQVYALDIHELLDLARSRVTRDLTPDECLRYFQSEKCPPLP